MVRVLIIDDDIKFEISISTVVQGLGFDIECVNSFQAGKGLIKDGDHELVLVDLNLPDGNGLELMTDTPNRHPSRFILIARLPSVDTEVGALKNTKRVADYLVKPVNPRKLWELV